MSQPTCRKMSWSKDSPPNCGRYSQTLSTTLRKPPVAGGHRPHSPDPEAGRAGLTLRNGRAPEPGALVEIADTGAGIPPEFASNYFSRSSRPRVSAGPGWASGCARGSSANMVDILELKSEQEGPHRGTDRLRLPRDKARHRSRGGLTPHTPGPPFCAGLPVR